MKSRGILGTIVLGSILTVAASPAAAATKCDLYFHLEGWSAFYKTAHGGGRVTCDNGQVRHVAIRMKAAGSRSVDPRSTATGSSPPSPTSGKCTAATRTPRHTLG